MSQIQIPYSLVTPSGTLTFNAEDGSDNYFLSEVQGLDGASVRSTYDVLPTRDGAYIYPSWRGAALPVLIGEIRIPDGNLTTRKTLMDNLLSYTDSIRNADGTLKWTPTGDTERSLTVRMLDAPLIGGTGVVKAFSIFLIAANPFAVSTTVQTQASGSLVVNSGSLTFPFHFKFSFGHSNGGLSSITNGGNTAAWPVITVAGPLGSVVMDNLTTGAELSMTTLGIIAGDSLVIDMFNQTVVLNGGASKIGYVDPTSDFWSLAPGANSIRISGAGTTGATGFSVAWTNTYIA